MIRNLTKNDLDISHRDLYIRQIVQIGIDFFQFCKIVDFVTDIQVWVTAEDKWFDPEGHLKVPESIPGRGIKILDLQGRLTDEALRRP